MPHDIHARLSRLFGNQTSQKISLFNIADRIEIMVIHRSVLVVFRTQIGIGVEEIFDLGIFTDHRRTAFGEHIIRRVLTVVHKVHDRILVDAKDDLFHLQFRHDVPHSQKLPAHRRRQKTASHFELVK